VRSPGFACDLLPALNLGFDDEGEDAEVLVLGFGLGLGLGLPLDFIGSRCSPGSRFG
jgi:hypothetical protein